jgi:hypothetical protein
MVRSVNDIVGARYQLDREWPPDERLEIRLGGLERKIPVKQSSIQCRDSGA